MASNEITLSITDLEIFKSLVELVVKMLDDERLPKEHKDAIRVWVETREWNNRIDIEKYICGGMK